VTAATALSAAVTGWALGQAAQAVAGDRAAPWIVGRAAGLAAYVLLALLVATGLLLSHPASARLRRPTAPTRLRVHVSLAACTLVVTALHVGVLAADPHAGVGWRGSLVPLGSTYRPVPVTLGLLGVYAGLAAGLTAGLAGHRVVSRVWWPVHKVAAVAFALVWAHGVLAGSDTPALLAVYLGTGGVLLVLAGWRYAAERPAEEVSR
jgi:hypothetical protein